MKLRNCQYFCKAGKRIVLQLPTVVFYIKGWSLTRSSLLLRRLRLNFFSCKWRVQKCLLSCRHFHIIWQSTITCFQVWSGITQTAPDFAISGLILYKMSVNDIISASLALMVTEVLVLARRCNALSNTWLNVRFILAESRRKLSR